MKGQVLDYSIQEGMGVITERSGSRYKFSGSEWKEKCVPVRGLAVDFDVQDGQAVAVYQDLESKNVANKDKVAAGLLAIFLGWLGVHKFYLGFTGSGLVYLLTNTLGWAVTWLLLGIPNLVLGVMALIEGVIYLTKSDEDFHKIYVVGKRKWF